MSPSFGKSLDALARTQSRLGESSRMRDEVLFVTWFFWSMVVGRALVGTVRGSRGCLVVASPSRLVFLKVLPSPFSERTLLEIETPPRVVRVVAEKKVGRR